MTKWNKEKIVRVFFQYCRKIYHWLQYIQLKNKNFSLIANNCNGGFILHDLGLKFMSPFVNLYINPDDYIYILENLPEMLNEELLFIHTDKSYPVAKLGQAKIYFYIMIQKRLRVVYGIQEKKE